MWRPLQKPEALPMLDEAATKLKEIYASLASLSSSVAVVSV
jgi:hypothetical protein